MTIRARTRRYNEVGGTDDVEAGFDSYRLDCRFKDVGSTIISFDADIPLGITEIGMIVEKQNM